MRTMRTRRPKSISLSARTTLARLAGFSSGATASSRSMQTESAALVAAFGIIAGRDAGTNNILRVKRTAEEVSFNTRTSNLELRTETEHEPSTKKTEIRTT